MAQSLETQRYLALMDELHAEAVAALGREWGAVNAVADRLGVHQSYMSKLKKGDRNVSQRAISAAIENLGLDANFFTDEALGDAPSYRDHLKGSKPVAARPAPAPLPEPRAVQAVARDAPATYEPLPTVLLQFEDQVPMTTPERDELRRYATETQFKGGLTPEVLQAYLDGLRRRGQSKVHQREADTSDQDAAAARATKRGGMAIPTKTKRP